MPGSHTRELKVFVVPKDKPAGPLRPAEPLTVEARTKDGVTPLDLAERLGWQEVVDLLARSR